MRVLVVSTSFPISEGSSSGIFVKRLVDELAKHVSIGVLVPDGSEPSIVDAEYTVHRFRYAPRKFQRLAHEPGGLPVIIKAKPLYCFLMPMFLLAFFFSVWRRSKGVDVIHANWSLAGLICGFVGKIRGIRVYTTLRGDDVSNVESSWLKCRIIRLIFLLNAKVLTVSESMSSELKRLFCDTDQLICHIPNGVNDQFLKVALMGENSTPLKLIYIGSLIPRKEVWVAIEALKQARIGATLTIIGNGPDRHQLERRAEKLGVSEVVHFLGPIPNDQVPDILSIHDALILPSNSEGRPNVIIEAMAAARVVLATKLPGVVEVITHRENGLLFDIGNVAELADLIRELDGCPSSKYQLGMAARQYVLDSGLTWSGSAKKYLENF